MICPLITGIHKFADGASKVVFAPCLRAECAWWVMGQEVCSVKSLALEANIMRLVLDAVAAQMPKQHQFVREE